MIVSLATTDAKAATGEELFAENCASCHIGSAESQERVAPPIFGVRDHYIKAYPEKDDFINAITDWLAKPEAGKSIMPGAISKFELMPQLEIAKEDAHEIAEYLYKGDFKQPEWYQEHYRQEHGDGQGMGQGHGKGKGHGMKNGEGHGQTGGWWKRLFGSDE